MKERAAMSIDLMHKDGQIELYQDRIIKLANRVDELERKAKKQAKRIVEMETKEVMQLVGSSHPEDNLEDDKRYGQYFDMCLYAM